MKNIKDFAKKLSPKELKKAIGNMAGETRDKYEIQCETLGIQTALMGYRKAKEDHDAGKDFQPKQFENIQMRNGYKDGMSDIRRGEWDDEDYERQAREFFRKMTLGMLFKNEKDN